MNELWERLRLGAQQMGTVVPALVGAAVILLTGYFLARHVFDPRGLPLPEPRATFLSRLERVAIEASPA